MSSSSIRCIISYQETKERLFVVSRYDNLLSMIKFIFNLSVDSQIDLIDESNSIMTFAAFEEYRFKGCKELKLKLVITGAGNGKFLSSKFDPLPVIKSRNSEKEKIESSPQGIYHFERNNLDVKSSNFTVNPSTVSENKRDIIPPETSSYSEKNYFKIEFKIIALCELDNIEILFSSKSRLSKLSQTILRRIGLENSDKVCFFYASNGQPLCPSFYDSQFLKISDVLSDNEKVYALVTNHHYKSESLQKDRLKHYYDVFVTNQITNQTNRLKVKTILGTDSIMKCRIGYALGCSSKSLDLNEIYENNYEYRIIANKPNLQISKYNPIMAQSEQGLRIFRNFMHCLPYKINLENRKKLIALIRYIVPFKPFLNSLYINFNDHLLTESELIALDEGSIILFQYLNNQYNLRLPNESLFEYTLEFFAILFELAELKSFTQDESEIIETRIIVNTERIINPVIVLNSEFEQVLYDLSIIEKFRKNGTEIIGIEGNMDDLQVDTELKKMIKRAEGVDRNELHIFETVYDETFDIKKIFNKGPIIKNFNDLERIKLKRNITQITSYIDLMQSYKKKTLTYNNKSKIVVNLGYNDIRGCLVGWDAFKGKECDLKNLYMASALDKPKNKDPSSKIIEDNEEDYSRIPDEAISFIIDTSISMEQNFLNTKVSRFVMATGLITSFVDRSSKCNLPQIFSLNSFDVKQNKISKFTQNKGKLCSYLKHVSCDKLTSIFDVIDSVISNLKSIKEVYKNIKTRIICFSDEGIGILKANLNDVIKNLVSYEIVFDLISLGSDCVGAKKLSLCSGGLFNRFESMKEVKELFECDFFNSLSSRKMFNISSNFLDSQLDSKNLINFAESSLKDIHLNQGTLINSYSIESGLSELEVSKPKSLGIIRIERIIKEIGICCEGLNPYIKIHPSQSDIHYWNAIITGPEGTPYEGGTFLLHINFTDNYPYSAPEIKFLTKIFHLNINSSGRIEIPELTTRYWHEISIAELLECIFEYLKRPEQNSSLEIDASQLFESSKAEYEKKAREWTMEFAMKQKYESREEISMEAIKNSLSQVGIY